MRQKSTPKDRMQEVLQELGISANEFERLCGIGNGFCTRLTHAITRRTRAKIKAAFPNVNMDYVSNGTGQIFEQPTETKDTLKDRILQFIKYMGITEKEFCRRSGIATTFIARMSENVRKSSLDSIFAAFPNISPEWLQYGTGDMLQEVGEQTKEDSTPAERIRRVIEFLSVPTAVFERETGIGIGTSRSTNPNITKRQVDRITSRYPFINPLWLMHGQGEMMVEKSKPLSKLAFGKFAFAPLVGQRAYAGFLCGFEDQAYIEKLDKIPYIVTEDTRGNNIIAVEVAGDSMDDGTYEAYKNGDIVLCKQLFLPDYRESLLPIRHYDFVIVHNEGVLIKRIAEHSIENRTITLHSLNKFYGDVTISLEDVKAIYCVLQRMSPQKR